MGKQEILRRVLLPESGASPVNRQFVGFTRHAMARVYAAQIRRELIAAGLADRPVTLTDRGVLSRLTAWAVEKSGMVTRGVNTRLRAAVANLTDTLADSAYLKAMRPVQQAIHQYNQDSLLPHMQATARNMAHVDFHTHNNAHARFELEGAAECPKCQALKDMGQVSGSFAQNNPLPLHPNCGCGWQVVAASATGATGPADSGSASDAWTGEGE